MMRTISPRCQFPDDLAIDPGDWSELAGPVAFVVRPAKPGRFMRLPFGGCAEAKGGGTVCVLALFGWTPGFVVEEAMCNAAVRVDTPVTQKRPVAPDSLDPGGIYFSNYYLFLVR